VIEGQMGALKWKHPKDEGGKERGRDEHSKKKTQESWTGL